MRALVAMACLGLSLLGGALWFGRAEPTGGISPDALDSRIAARIPPDPHGMAKVEAHHPEAARAPAESAPREAQHALSGRCVDLAGRPLSGVLISGSARVLGHTTSDPEGRYELAFDPEPLARRSGLVELSRRDLGHESVPVPRGAAGRIDLGETRLVAGGTLRGRVLSAEGIPLPDARVHAKSDSAGRSASGSTSTDGLGVWVIPGLPHGAYEVTARLLGAREQEPLRPTLLGIEHEAGDLWLTPIDEGSLLRGRVFGTDGLARPGAGVHYRRAHQSSGGRGSVTVDSQGRFVVVGSPGARFELFALDPDSTEISELVEATCGALELGVHLRELPRTELAVVDAGGRPVTEFGYWVADSTTDRWYGTGAPIEHRAGGVARIPLLPRPFDLTVQAWSFERLDQKRIDPASVGDRWTARLQPLSESD